MNAKQKAKKLRILPVTAGEIPYKRRDSKFLTSLRFLCRVVCSNLLPIYHFIFFAPLSIRESHILSTSMNSSSYRPMGSTFPLQVLYLWRGGNKESI